MRIETTSDTCNIIQKVPADGPVSGWKIYIAGGANLLIYQLWGESGGTFMVACTWNPTNGKWHCIDATYDGRYGKLYVDNVEVHDGDIGRDEALGTHNGAMLVSDATDYPGQIEGLAIWNQPRTPAERAMLWHSGKRIALAEVRLMDYTELEGYLDLTYDDRNYGPDGDSRNLAVIDSLVLGGGPFTDHLGEAAGGYGAAYCPPIIDPERRQRHCTHNELAETTGH